MGSVGFKCRDLILCDFLPRFDSLITSFRDFARQKKNAQSSNLGPREPKKSNLVCHSGRSPTKESEVEALRAR